MADPVLNGARWRVDHGDALEVLRGLPEGCVDAVVTSPPYAMQRSATYGGVPEAEYPAWTVAWMGALRHALKPRASVLINIREHVRDGELSDYVHRTRLAVREAGWIECDELIWDKKSGPPIGLVSRPRRSWERVLWFSPSRDPWVDVRANGAEAGLYAFGGDQGGAFHGVGNGWMSRGEWPEGYISRCIDIIRVNQREIQDQQHPAAFPLNVPRWLVRFACSPGGLVCDPFAGSGTTGVAALAEGCRALLVERDPGYVEIARARLRATAARPLGYRAAPTTATQMDLLPAASRVGG